MITAKTRVRNRRDTIRQLRPGEPVPDGAPRRYNTEQGYIRLRWKVGTGQYVEAYEHRVVDGHITTAEHVHHRNGIKTDNRPENLSYLTADEHNHHHGALAESKWRPFRSFEAAWKAAHAENWRFDRDKRTALLRQLHAEGLSTIEIGRRVGLHASGVWRYINLGVNP